MLARVIVLIILVGFLVWDVLLVKNWFEASGDKLVTPASGPKLEMLFSESGVGITSVSPMSTKLAKVVATSFEGMTGCTQW